jgi:cysteinyl-tRNA synthetase, unknown class
MSTDLSLVSLRHRSHLVLFCLCAAFSNFGCSHWSPSSSSASPGLFLSGSPVATSRIGASPIEDSQTNRKLTAGQTWKVSSFGIQLQGLDVTQSKTSPFQMLICDYSRDGSAAGRYSREEVSLLKSGGRRLVGYLSVGEAESYRGYWKPGWKPGRPVWLGPTNPDWGGNYKVHYWDPQWQSVIFQYADTILEQGFDGLFLDVVDAYEFWESKRPTASADMVQLILGLTQHVRAKYGQNIGIFLNGGAGLVADPTLLSSITGIAKEEIFFGLGGDDRPTTAEFTKQALQELEPVTKSGKLVLSIDYTSKLDQARVAHQKASQAGYLEYVGVRNLDRLVLDANRLDK